MVSHQQRRTHARAIFQAALDASAPHRCIERCLRVAGDNLHIFDRVYPLKKLSRLVVIGAGKATPAMAAATENLLGQYISVGAINTKYGHSLPLASIATTECGHPLPDDPGVEGTARMIRLISALDRDALVLCLFSGGGSALMPAPADGLTLAEKQQTTQLLLACGATHRADKHRPQTPFCGQRRPTRPFGPARPGRGFANLGCDRGPPRYHRLGPHPSPIPLPLPSALPWLTTTASMIACPPRYGSV